jgi:hypothetical protein
VVEKHELHPPCTAEVAMAADDLGLAVFSIWRLCDFFGLCSTLTPISSSTFFFDTHTTCSNRFLVHK